MKESIVKYLRSPVRILLRSCLVLLVSFTIVTFPRHSLYLASSFHLPTPPSLLPDPVSVENYSLSQQLRQRLHDTSPFLTQQQTLSQRLTYIRLFHPIPVDPFTRSQHSGLFATQSPDVFRIYSQPIRTKLEPVPFHPFQRSKRTLPGLSFSLVFLSNISKPGAGSIQSFCSLAVCCFPFLLLSGLHFAPIHRRLSLNQV